MIYSADMLKEEVEMGLIVGIIVGAISGCIAGALMDSKGGLIRNIILGRLWVPVL